MERRYQRQNPSLRQTTNGERTHLIEAFLNNAQAGQRKGSPTVEPQRVEAQVPSIENHSFAAKSRRQKIFELTIFSIIF